MATGASGVTPELDQRMRQLIGAGVEFAVAEHLVVEDQCRSIRSGFGLPFKQRMDALLRHRGRRGIPVHQQLLALLGREHVQGTQRRLRRVFQRVHQDL